MDNRDRRLPNSQPIAWCLIDSESSLPGKMLEHHPSGQGCDVRWEGENGQRTIEKAVDEKGMTRRCVVRETNLIILLAMSLVLPIPPLSSASMRYRILSHRFRLAVPDPWGSSRGPGQVSMVSFPRAEEEHRLRAISRPSSTTLSSTLPCPRKPVLLI